MTYQIESHIISTAFQPILKNVLIPLGRGGAILAASTLANRALSVPRGGGGNRNNKAVAITANTKDTKDVKLNVFGLQLTPEGKSVLLMALAMSLHYFGYALARPITLSLFTSATAGYKGSSAAFPFAMAFISPVSLLLLAGYGYALEIGKPRGALLASSFFCAAVITLSSLAITIFEKTNTLIAGIPAAKFVTGPLFIFRESYVQLLTSQYWSFMASVLTPNQSARWFAPIAGLTSITSAVAGISVSFLSERIGLTGVLMGTGIMLLGSMIVASAGYNVAREYGFEPAELKSKQVVPKHQHSGEKQQSNQVQSVDSHNVGIIQKATRLFQRVPVLQALFLEILASQGLATVLNICFVNRLGKSIANDSDRAGWVGMYFAIINVITMVLQFGILPKLMTFLEPRDLWRALPIVSLLFTVVQSLSKDPSLYLVASSLLVMKVSEYSVRRMLDEMIFVPLDFESRFLGKEVLGVFGFRFGKSLMSLALSAISALDSDLGLQKLSFVSTLVATGWLSAAWKLSNMVPTRAEAEAAHKLRKQQKMR